MKLFICYRPEYGFVSHQVMKTYENDEASRTIQKPMDTVQPRVVCRFGKIPI